MTLNCNGKILDLKIPKVMGILNITPDSFFDGGKYTQEKEILLQAEKMLLEGATFIDVGAYSSRPGAIHISENEEQQRLLPVIELLVANFPEIIISVDTFRSNIAKQTIEAGAAIINDISAGKMDAQMFDIVASLQIPYIIMHMQGTPQTMQINPSYDNVLLDIYDFFENEIEKFKKFKHHKKLILDPGIGFGKNLKHNLMILNKISLFHSLGFPILIGTSRKRFINEISEKYDSKERIGGTLSSTIYCFLQGVKIFRVHNVKEIKQGLLVFETLLNK